MRDILVNVVNESHEPQLGQLSMPVHLVWGSDDHDVPIEVARRAELLIQSDHSLNLLPGVGHMVPTEAPGALVEVILGVLQ